MVELTKKLVKLGNSYAIIIPKLLVDAKVLDYNKELKIKIENTETRPFLNVGCQYPIPIIY